MTSARRATSAIFLVCGTATSCWAPMVPFAKARLSLDDATLLTLGLTERPSLLEDRGAAAGVRVRLVPSARVLGLGALCFIAFLAEGAVLDWSAVFLHEQVGLGLTSAGIGYAAFSIAMVTGRLTGDAMVHRIGARRLLQVGSVLAVVGFGLVAATPGAPVALAGFALVGLGASNIVPLLFTASAQVPGVPPSLALATVTTIAYVGLLAGPALIGFVADASSLPVAFGLTAALLALIPLTATRVM